MAGVLDLIWEWLVPVVFGWPAILVALTLVGLGIARRRPGWVVTATVVAVPFTYYLWGASLFRWWALTLPLGLLGAAWATARGRPRWAALLAAPFAVVVVWLAIAVARSWQMWSRLSGTAP